ncbi:MAG: alpha/beta hydrolase [Gammaproteobacteria bacterium]
MQNKPKDSELSLELSSVEINPQHRALNAVIWMHGLGADGYDFAPVVESLPQSIQDSTRFIFPNAPIRSITLNAGMRMRGWYDIASLELNRNADEIGIRQSLEQIHYLIRKQNTEHAIPSERIALVGFSQGGAMALFAGLRYPERLAGLVALSTYLPLPEQLDQELSSANQSVPIFQAHGSFDPIVPFRLGQEAYTRLRNLNYPIQWQTYNLAHTVDAQEIDDIGRFLVQVFSRHA